MTELQVLVDSLNRLSSSLNDTKLKANSTSQISLINTQIGHLTAQINDLTNRLITVETSETQQNNSLSSIIVDLTSLTERFEMMLNDMGVYRNDVSNRVNDCVQNNVETVNRVNDTLNRIDENSMRLDEHDNRFESVDTQITSTYDTIYSYASEHDGIREQIDYVDYRVAENEGQYYELSWRVDDHQSRIETLEANDIVWRVDDHQNRIETLESNDVTWRVDDHESRIETLEANDITWRVDNHETRITDNENYGREMNTRLDDHQVRIESLESSSGNDGSSSNPSPFDIFDETDRALIEETLKLTPYPPKNQNYVIYYLAAHDMYVYLPLPDYTESWSDIETLVQNLSPWASPLELPFEFEAKVLVMVSCYINLNHYFTGLSCLEVPKLVVKGKYVKEFYPHHGVDVLKLPIGGNSGGVRAYHLVFDYSDIPCYPSADIVLKARDDEGRYTLELIYSIEIIGDLNSCNLTIVENDYYEEDYCSNRYLAYGLQRIIFPKAYEWSSFSSTVPLDGLKLIDMSCAGSCGSISKLDIRENYNVVCIKSLCDISISYDIQARNRNALKFDCPCLSEEQRESLYTDYCTFTE